jgi:UDP-N-acetylmuramoyl-tripeptide--D-alanyl-D-alanine ligase
VIPLETDLLERLGTLDARSAQVTGVQVDSRRVLPGDLFVAVGRGAEFAGDALARGAAATLLPDDAFAALARIGAAVRDRSDARVVGITGSMGKTSTKDILAALCSPSARTIAAEASFNNEIGVPLTLCRLEPDTEVCILELAMRGFGQIAELCGIARPQIGVVTNIGPVHLELVESIEGVLRAKGELVAALPVGSTAVVPEDFPVDRDDIDVVHVGPVEGEVIDGADVHGLPRPGSVDVDFARWRGEERQLPGGGLLINDAYNANPVSMRAALAYLVERAGDRRRATGRSPRRPTRDAAGRGRRPRRARSPRFAPDGAR